MSFTVGRYLQNNFDFLNTLIFDVFFTYFHNFAPQKSFKVDNNWMEMEFFGN